MARFLILVALFIAQWAYGSICALAANKRVALVVANGSYKVGDRLVNPINDSTLIASALKRAKFDVVELQTDLGIAQFRQTLRQFRSQADGAEVALIYFAGHGVEVDGINWLVPTDAELRETRDLEYEAIKLDLALQALGGARVRIIALDACRNNPFAASWTSAARTVSRGLGRQEADGVLVLFAAAPGQVASDGKGSNSPFATALAKRLPEEGLAIQLLGGRVRDDVLAATGNTQRAFVSASITGEPYYLVQSAKTKPAATREIELLFWSSVKDSTSPAVLRTYLDRYPKGEFATIARALIQHYEQQAKLSLAAREEESRRQEEARKDAEIKRLELERRARETALAEERIRARRAKDELEVKRIEERERQEHVARQEQLRKAQEQARIAKEAAKAAEQDRLAAARSAEKAAKAATAEIAAKKKATKSKDTAKLAALSVPKPTVASKGLCKVDPFGRLHGTGAATQGGANATMTASHGTECGFGNWMNSDGTGRPDKLGVSRQPSNGSVRIDGNRTLYRSKEGFKGTDHFSIVGEGLIKATGRRSSYNVRVTVTVVD